MSLTKYIISHAFEIKLLIVFGMFYITTYSLYELYKIYGPILTSDDIFNLSKISNSF